MDSGNDDCNDPDRLCAAQLNTAAEFYFEDNDRDDIAESLKLDDSSSLNKPHFIKRIKIILVVGPLGFFRKCQAKFSRPLTYQVII